MKKKTDRLMECDTCKKVKHRDVNAALNMATVWNNSVLFRRRPQFLKKKKMIEE